MRRQTTTPRREPSLRVPIVVTLVGELDYPSAARANRELDPVTAGDRPHMVLDLTRVDFLDCGGIGVLCRARRRTRAHGGRLSLVITDPRFLRILDAVGLTGSFDILSAAPDTARPADDGPCVTGCDGPVSAAAALTAEVRGAGLARGPDLGGAEGAVHIGEVVRRGLGPVEEEVVDRLGHVLEDLVGAGGVAEVGGDPAGAQEPAVARVAAVLAGGMACGGGGEGALHLGGGGQFQGAVGDVGRLRHEQVLDDGDLGVEEGVVLLLEPRVGPHTVAPGVEPGRVVGAQLPVHLLELRRVVAPQELEERPGVVVEAEAVAGVGRMQQLADAHPWPAARRVRDDALDQRPAYGDPVVTGRAVEEFGAALVHGGGAVALVPGAFTEETGDGKPAVQVVDVLVPEELFEGEGGVLGDAALVGVEGGAALDVDAAVVGGHAGEQRVVDLVVGARGVQHDVQGGVGVAGERLTGPDHPVELGFDLLGRVVELVDGGAVEGGADLDGAVVVGVGVREDPLFDVRLAHPVRGAGPEVVEPAGDLAPRLAALAVVLHGGGDQGAEVGDDARPERGDLTEAAVLAEGVADDPGVGCALEMGVAHKALEDGPVAGIGGDRGDEGAVLVTGVDAQVVDGERGEGGIPP